jgi:hypothetical protein
MIVLISYSFDVPCCFVDYSPLNYSLQNNMIRQ